MRPLLLLAAAAAIAAVLAGCGPEHDEVANCSAEHSDGVRYVVREPPRYLVVCNNGQVFTVPTTTQP